MKSELSKIVGKGYRQFELVFLTVLDKHAPIKTRKVRANEVPYMTKALRRAIANRSRLENKYYKRKTPESLATYKKHKNYCSWLYKRERKRFNCKLDANSVTDSKLFWKVTKPYFSNKGLTSKQITLIEGDKIISDDQNVAETFNTFFENAVKSLGINIETGHANDSVSLSDPVDAAIKKYENHPSIKMINSKFNQRASFSFQNANASDIESAIKKLKLNKASPFSNITAKELKTYGDICSSHVLDIVNSSIQN